MILSEGVSEFLLMAVMLLGAVAVAGLWFFWYYDDDRPRSWLLWTAATATTPLVAATWYLAWIASIRLHAGLLAIPGWTLDATIVTVIAMGLTAPYFVLQMIRHGHG